MSVKVWLMCSDLIWFERPPLCGICPICVPELIYHAFLTLLFFFFFPAGPLWVTPASTWRTAQVWWCSDLPRREESFKSIRPAKISSLRCNWGLFYRGSFQWRQKVSQSSIWGLLASSRLPLLRSSVDSPLIIFAFPLQGWPGEGSWILKWLYI